MPDVFRAVTLDPSGRIRLVLDLNAPSSIYRERSTFRVTPGARRERIATSDQRYAGARVTAAVRDNATASVTLVVKDETSHALAAARVEGLLAICDRAAAQGGLYLHCKPADLPNPVLLEVRGPATVQPVYEAHVFTGARLMRVEVSWPVAPLAEGQPMDVVDDFRPPPDKPGGLVNLVPNPGAEVGDIGWLLNGTTARSATVPHRGLWAWRWAAAGPETANNIQGDPVVAVRPGVVHTFAVWIRPDAGSTGGVHLRIANASLSLTYLDALVTLSAGPAVWRREVYQFTPTEAFVGLRTTNDGATGGYYLDDWAVFEGAYSAATMPDFDGDSASARWEGTPHASRSIELVESKLAEYTVGAAPAVVDRDGLHTTDASGALIVHSARGYEVADSEVVVTGTFDAGVITADFLTPGLRYRSDDGLFLFATLSSDTLYIIYYNGSGTVALANVAGFAAVTGRLYSVVIRAVGDLIEAEFWTGRPVRGGTPGAAVSVLLTEATAAKASVMGAGRRGYAMPRASKIAAAGGKSTVREFRALPYSLGKPAAGGPRTLRLPDVPGSAPAKTDVELGTGAVTAVPFGLLAWRKRKAHSFIGNGDVAVDLDGWVVDTSAGFSMTRVATGGPGDGPYVEVTSGSVGNAGLRYFSYAPVRRGRRYTLEFWGYAAVTSTDWAIQGDAVLSAAANNLDAAAGVWKRYTVAFVATADGHTFELKFIHNPAVAGRVARFARVRFYEGERADDPLGLVGPEGRGAHPPFGVIFAEADDPSQRVNFAGAASAGELTGRKLVLNTGSTLTGSVEYVIDPELAGLLEDAETGDIDVEVYAVGALASTVVTPRLTASLLPIGPAVGRQYTREFGSLGRPVTLPSSGTLRRTWRLGTLTFTRDPRQPGRQQLRVAAAGGAGSTGNIELAYLILAPVRARAASPTGLVLDSAYPLLLTAQAVAAVKTIRSDLRGVLTRPDLSASARDTGLSGEPVELDPGDSELLVWAQEGTVPDDPTVGALVAADSQLGVHVAVTPRYRFLRDD